MEDTQFLNLANAKLLSLQDELEDANDDVSCLMNGHVLTVELDNGGEVIINIQAPMQEIWLASFKGGYHFKYVDGKWLENQTKESLDKMAQDAIDALR